jgi:trehalose 6-phosphate phosphatase
MRLPELTCPERIALFLDFDGTLVEIAERPDAVRVASTTRDNLTRIQTALGGALAIVTGREIEVIDAMLAPFRCPVAGVHGLTRRNSAGRTLIKPGPADFVERAKRHLSPLLESEPKLLLEPKSSAIALHYRARPDLEHIVLAAMQEVANLIDGVRLVRGKMVVEARPDGGDKGTAIVDFLGEPPFSGRLPIFAGDDVTDEDAFELVNELAGISLKIGAGDTAARWRAADTAQFLAWLGMTADNLEKGSTIA